jgi:hypothetical protein
VFVPEPEPHDERPVCTPRAAGLLADVLGADARPLLDEWLDMAAARGYRPPAEHLPKLLDLAAARRDIRSVVAGVIGGRGRWLAQFNPRWQSASAQEEVTEDSWQVGTRAQRALLLRTLRGVAPDRVRALVASTWSVDAADERAEWVAAMTHGLCDEDEPFLEGCLDDRSSRVREAAADLLARLPQSRFVARMTERGATLVNFEPGTRANLLKLARGVPARLSVTLPETFDKAMLRDGLSDKPPPKLGPKQWWFFQITASVPLQHWSETTRATPSALIAALPEDFGALVLAAWMKALARLPDPLWIEPLLEAARTEVPVTAEVLRVVPVARRAEVLGTLAGKPHDVVAPAKVVAAWRPLGEEVSRQMIQSWDPAVILQTEAVFAIHPAALGLLEARFLECPGGQALKRQVEAALSTIAKRRLIHEEFAP